MEGSEQGVWQKCGSIGRARAGLWGGAHLLGEHGDFVGELAVYVLEEDRGLLGEACGGRRRHWFAKGPCHVTEDSKFEIRTSARLARLLIFFNKQSRRK